MNASPNRTQEIASESAETVARLGRVLQRTRRAESELAAVLARAPKSRDVQHYAPPVTVPQHRKVAGAAAAFSAWLLLMWLLAYALAAWFDQF